MTGLINKIECIDAEVSNYSILPSSGHRNQIALINDVDINNVYIQQDEPFEPTQGDIWIKIGFFGNVYLFFKNYTYIYLTTCRQYNNDAWSVITDWYVFMEEWTPARMLIVKDGQYVYPWSTYTNTAWQRVSGLSGVSSTFSQTSTYMQFYIKNSKSNGGYTASSLLVPYTNAGQYSQIYASIYGASSGGTGNKQKYVVISKRGFSSSTGVKYWAYQSLLNNTTAANKQATVPITNTDTLVSIHVGFEVGYNGNTSTLRIYDLWLE